MSENVVQFVKPRVPLELDTMTCASCGVEFAAPAAWVKAKRETHEGFVCINGHSLSFPQQTQSDKLAEENKALKAQIAGLEKQIAELRRPSGRMLKFAKKVGLVQ